MSEVIGKLVVQLITTLINSALVMWFWNDGLVGAVDGIHTVGYPRALFIFLMVQCFLEPLVRLSKDEK
jgi:hypothetical protein